jgi:hypothetical protein
MVFFNAIVFYKFLFEIIFVFYHSFNHFQMVGYKEELKNEKKIS